MKHDCFFFKENFILQNFVYNSEMANWHILMLKHRKIDGEYSKHCLLAWQNKIN